MRRLNAASQPNRGPANARSCNLYHVEAGITIRDLSLRLDQKDRTTEGEGATVRAPDMPTVDPRPLAGRRWALPTMGGASGQTLAGAVSTGTHGGDHSLPPMADAVRAIHLVGVDGRQHWIEDDAGITDESHLREALPDVEVHYSSGLFSAALVSVGRLGIH